MPEKEDDKTFVADLIKDLDIDVTVEKDAFRHGPARAASRTPHPLLIRFATEKDNYTFIKAFNSRCKEKKMDSSARSHLSPSETVLYREAWRECISRNDKAGRKEWTVRGLNLFKLPEPQPWTPTARPPSSQPAVSSAPR